MFELRLAQCLHGLAIELGDDTRALTCDIHRVATLKRLPNLIRLQLVSLVLFIALGPVLPVFAEEPFYGPVRSGETLWGIAGSLYGGAGLNRDQIMLALLEANPDAFSPSCNLHGVLRVGVLLRMPPLEQVRRLDAGSASAIVKLQARQWAAHLGGEQPIECPVTSEDADPSTASADTATDVGETLDPEGTTVSFGVSVLPDAAEMATMDTLDALPLPDLPRTWAHSAPPRVAVLLSTSPTPDSEPGGHLDLEADDGAASEQLTAPRLKDGGGEGSIAPEGARAPLWALVALLIALIAAAMVRWEHRWAISGDSLTASAALGAAARLPKRAMLLLSTGQTELYLLLLMATLAGFFGALVTVLFREGIRLLEWLVSGQDQGLVAAAEALKPWQRLLLPVVGGLLAGLILQQVGGLLRGRSTTDYMEAVAVGDGWISVRHSLVKASSSLVTVASGGSIGREGAMVQLAAMVASVMGRISRFPRDRLRLLVAAGAAAGLASAYNAPIAATLFVAEIVLGSIALEHIGPLIIAAVIANTTVHEILGYAPVYQIPAFSLVSDWELALYLVLGILAGHLAPMFLSLLERSHQLFGRLPMPLAGRMALGGLVVGAISVYEPQVWGNGYSVVNAVLQDPWAWQALLTVLVLKMIATAATHGSGAVGGAFTPTIFVGAMLGALFGTLVHGLLPDGTATPSAYAVVGMGAMLAGTTHAPLMSILMVFELTMDYDIVLPLMLAVITAHYTARRYSGVRPMYADSLLPRERPA